MFKQLKEDLILLWNATLLPCSRLEVYLLYSGFKAVRSYRKANWFYRHNMKFIARWISQRSRHKTGIEIHPGAKIGKDYSLTMVWEWSLEKQLKLEITVPFIKM